jgi:hypothetical protein
MNKLSPADLLRTLWQEGFFSTPKQLTQIAERLEEGGHRLNSSHLTLSLIRIMRNEKFLTRKKTDGQWTYAQSRPSKTAKMQSAETELFDEKLIGKFGKPFETDVDDLHLNFDRSGNGTAFFLRKILEKLIYIAFAKNGYGLKIEDKIAPGRIVGLDAMISIAAKEKVNGTPFLSHKTAQELKGIKFLGDASAHNPLTDVDMTTILPQLPFIITAYKELSRLL